MGALPGGSSSSAFWISGNGLIIGQSQNGVIDPLTGIPEGDAVLWKDDQITNLGTLGGNFSVTQAVNNQGRIVGAALNAIPDPISFLGTQIRAFLWQDGTMQDLGTLGGPDAWGFLVNERGQVAGWSLTNSTPNPVLDSCGFGTTFPTQDPFLWENGSMIDLGTLGGTCGYPTAINNRGQVVGDSDLTGDLLIRPFLWTKSQGMRDLGTLGGNTGFANWINEAGDIAGKGDLPGLLSPQNHHAILWRNGVMIDLGTLPGDSSSNAYYVNSRGQVVGTSEDRQHMLMGVGEHAFLWEDGGPWSN